MQNNLFRNRQRASPRLETPAVIYFSHLQAMINNMTIQTAITHGMIHLSKPLSPKHRTIIGIKIQTSKKDATITTILDFIKPPLLFR